MKKPAFKRKKPEAKLPTRITNETVAEHREQILAGGRKFKYPVQYVRHRLVVNTIVISLIALVGFGVFVWYQLYQAQNTGSFMYRVSRILPLPVATVDGEWVKYSDYLMYYRSQEYYLTRYGQTDLSTAESMHEQLEWVKRGVLDNVEADAYAAKIARERNVSITDEEINAVREADRIMQNGTISQEARDVSMRTVFGWSPEEYETEIRRRLLMHKVSYLVDDAAAAKRDKASSLVKQPDAAFAAIATQLTDDTSTVEHGVSGMIPLNNTTSGLAKDAVALNQGQISGAIRGASGDGYYFVRVIEKTASQINYEFIKIPLTQFKAAVEKLRKDGKVSEFIEVSDVKPANTTAPAKE